MSEALNDPGCERELRDRGETMVMTVLLITFLMLGSWTLISASQQWGARRDVQAVSSAAARAGTQVTEAEVRGGSVTIDPSRAASRANAVLAAFALLHAWHGRGPRFASSPEPDERPQRMLARDWRAGRDRPRSAPRPRPKG